MNNAQSSHQLIVYSASAGSGKTYTLTRDFLRMALRDPHDAFRHLLAITFTRKATQEMKSRILSTLSQLRMLADGESESSAAAQSLAEELAQEGGLRVEEVGARAQEALIAILTDYSALRIRTIDSFFDEVLRSFALEIGYGSSYKLDLEMDTRIHRAALMLFQKLAEEGASDVFKQIQSIVGNVVSSGDKFDVLSKVEEIGKELYNYKVQAMIINESLPTHQEISEGQAALEQFIGQGEGSANSFYMEAAQLLLQDLPYFGTLSALYKQAQEIGRTSNTLLLSATQTFMQQILESGADIPFIYEKMGTKLHHYLIDEFQDTSRQQYSNLKPLIEDGLANGRESLFVGDIKQSIYKFRHCDRTILSDTVPSEFAPFYQKRVLQYNWRSTPQVVNFNNTLYKHASIRVASLLQEIIEELLGKNPDEKKKKETPDANPLAAIPDVVEQLRQLPGNIVANFEDLKQLLPEGKKRKEGGVELIQVESGQQLPSLVEQVLILCKEKGYAPNDIAVLCSRNKEVEMVANALLEHAKQHPEDAPYLKFTGAEALKITNSTLILLIIDLLKALNTPAQKAFYKRAEYQYQQLHEQQGGGAPYLPFEELFEQMQAEYTHLNLFDLVELFLSLCQPIVRDTDVPYVAMLMDMVLTYGEEHTADLFSFLQWWDNKGCKADLPRENVDDAITLITIHKSKGLEFPIVLLPYLNWNLGFPRNTSNKFLWVDVPPYFRSLTSFNLPIAPVKMVKNIRSSIFVKDYLEELSKEVIDRLNLAYVATTRAERGMMIWLEEKTGKLSSLEIPLDALLAEWLEMGPQSEDGAQLFTPIPHKEQGASDAATQQAATPLQLHASDFTRRASHNIAIRCDAARFFAQEQQRNYGSIMHEILSRIYTIDDLPEAFAALVAQGFISEHDARKEMDILLSILQTPPISSWFQKGITILNEQPILTPEGQSYRPDRVVILPEGKAIVIDYKFGQQRAEHHDQVKHYCQMLSQMGYQSIEGYLLYLCGISYNIKQVV